MPTSRNMKRLKQPAFIPQGTRNSTKPKGGRRKGKTTIRAKINEIETKKTIERINETISWFFVKVNQVRTFSQTHQEKERA